MTLYSNTFKLWLSASKKLKSVNICKGYKQEVSVLACTSIVF